MGALDTNDAVKFDDAYSDNTPEDKFSFSVCHFLADKQIYELRFALFSTFELKLIN